MEYRRKDIQELLDFFHTQVSDRAAPQGDGPAPGHACRYLNGSSLCDASILGNVWRAMLRNGREGLFPKQADDVPEESVNSLLSVFSASFTMPSPGKKVAFYHEGCSPQSALKEIDNRLWSISEWQNRLLRDHDKEHMARRRLVLGCEWDS
jgi:hypothetical protein